MQLLYICSLKKYISIMIKSKTIVITGSEGKIGKALRKYFQKKILL